MLNLCTECTFKIRLQQGKQIRTQCLKCTHCHSATLSQLVRNCCSSQSPEMLPQSLLSSLVRHATPRQLLLGRNAFQSVWFCAMSVGFRCSTEPLALLDWQSWFCRHTGMCTHTHTHARTHTHSVLCSTEQTFLDEKLAHLFSLQSFADCVDGWRAQTVKCSLICPPSPPCSCLPLSSLFSTSLSFHATAFFPLLACFCLLRCFSLYDSNCFILKCSCSLFL